MTKKCIAAGKAHKSKIWMAYTRLIFDDQLTETCPNPECGHPKDPISGSVQDQTITYFYVCSQEGCGVHWTRKETFSPADATVLGGDSDGNIYTSTSEALS
jgi:hypothetical protein